MEFYLGQIEIFAQNRMPRSWLPCDGRELPIEKYQALYLLLGTRFGGDGIKTFALPDLRGRVPVGQDPDGYRLGTAFGTETHTLTEAEIPPHSHRIAAAAKDVPWAETYDPPPQSILGRGKIRTSPHRSAPLPVFAEAAEAALVPLAEGSVSSEAGGQPHSNMMPFVAMQWFMCVDKGVYPDRSH